MRVKVYPLAASPLDVELPDEPGVEITVKHIFSQSGTGRCFGDPENTIMGVIQERHGGFENFGSVSVNGDQADLGTVLSDGDVIMIVPRVQGG